MSDSWYRDPPDLPPYEDGAGKLWTLDGVCLNPDPPAEPTWLDEWPPELQYAALQAAVCMELRDSWERKLMEIEQEAIDNLRRALGDR